MGRVVEGEEVGADFFIKVGFFFIKDKFNIFAIFILSIINERRKTLTDRF